MPFQFDAVVWDIVRPFLLILAPVLLVDVILILALRRIGTHRLSQTSTAHETQITSNVHFDPNNNVDSIITDETSTRGITTNETSTDFRTA